MAAIPFPLIDVLSADSFAEEHIPGAVNLCVYETAFTDKVRKAFPDQTAAITVYGFSDATREAQAALEKLNAAGYQKVTVLEGGLETWRTQGGETEKAEGKAAVSGRSEIDIGQSFIHWTGRNLFNFHTGGLRLAGGHLEFEGGKLVAAEIGVDMTSLACSDLSDLKMNQMLIAHLRSDDFFAVDSHPSAKFVLTSAEEIKDVSPGLPNYRFFGDFTLRGIIRPIDFTAVVGEKEDGGFVAQALFNIDRTQWNSIYGSGKFFARLGQHVVNDLIHLQLKIVAAPPRA